MARKKLSADIVPASNAAEDKEVGQRYTQMAKKLKALYLNQDKLIPEMGLSKAVWRILLEIYIARKELRNVCVTRIRSMVNIPSTTSIRAVEYLVENGLIYKTDDPLHEKRKFLHLTNNGFKIVHTMISDFIKSLKE